MIKNYNIVPVHEYTRREDFVKNKFLETVFLDEDFFQSAIDFYNKFFGYKNHKIDKEEALMYAKLGTRLNAEFFRIMRPSDEHELNNFYRCTPFHFFNNIIRFMDGMHRTIVQEFCEKAKSPILDFGGGTGGFSVLLSLKGFQVTYVESNIMCLEWMKYAKKLYNLTNLTILNDSDKIDGKFNLVIAKDIIEHVINPKGFHDFLTSLIEKDGQLYLTHYPCCGPDEFAPMHFRVDSWEEDGQSFLYGNPEANLDYLKTGVFNASKFDYPGKK